MTSQTTERAFENAVESTLLEQRMAESRRFRMGRREPPYSPNRPSTSSKPHNPTCGRRSPSLHGTSLKAKSQQTLIKTLNDRGTLDVLRHGFRFSGQTLRVAFFKPANDLNPDTMANYHANRLTITRQVPCHP